MAPTGTPGGSGECTSWKPERSVRRLALSCAEPVAEIMRTTSGTVSEGHRTNVFIPTSPSGGSWGHFPPLTSTSLRRSACDRQLVPHHIRARGRLTVHSNGGGQQP